MRKSTMDKLIMLVLRTLPIIPAPDLYEIFKELNTSKFSIDTKIDRVTQSLKESSMLIQELQEEMQYRSEKLVELKERYENYEKLAGIEEDKIQPLIGQLELVVNKGKNAERIISFAINIIAGLIIFVIGILLGPTVQSWFK